MSGAFSILLILVGLGCLGTFLIGSLWEWMSKHKQLKIQIRKLDDGRYKVTYYWSIWETNVEIIPDERPLLYEFLTDLVSRSLKQ